MQNIQLTTRDMGTLTGVDAIHVVEAGLKTRLLLAS